MIQWNKIHIGILLLIVTAISLIPFFSVGFTTADDLEYYLTMLRGDLFEDAQSYAQNTGRFYFLITKPIYSLVYWLDNFYITKILQHGSLLFSYVAFSFLIYKILKSKSIAICIYILLVVATPITGNWHMPFIAYPGYFTTSFGLMCCALIMYVKYLERNRYLYTIGSAILFSFVVLFYETYLLFLFYFCIFILVRWIYITGIKQVFCKKEFYKEIVPYAIVGIIYVLIYFSYSASSASSYSGATISDTFSLKNFFIVLKRCTHGAFPLQSFMYNDFSFQNVPLLVYLKAIFVGIISINLLRKFQGNISWNVLFVLLPVSLFFAYTSHFLVGLAEKYNLEWYSWMEGYVTTYYAYFGVIFSTIIIGYIFLKLVKNIKILYYGIETLIIILILTITIITGFSNRRMASKWEQTQAIFPMMDKMVEMGIYDSVKEQDIVYAEDFYNIGAFGNCLWHPHIYWSDYIFQKYDIKLRDCKNIEELSNQVNDSTTIFYLHHLERENELFVCLAKIRKHENYFSTEEFQSDSIVIIGNNTKTAKLEYNFSQEGVTEIKRILLDVKDSQLSKIIITDKNTYPNSISFSSN